VQIVQDGARVVLADVTHITGVTTSMVVWTVIGIVTAPLPVDKVVRMALVNAGQETVHRVSMVIGAQTATGSAVSGVQKAHVIIQMELVQFASPVIGVSDVSNNAAMAVR